MASLVARGDIEQEEAADHFLASAKGPSMTRRWPKAPAAVRCSVDSELLASSTPRDCK
jgi:hypothetical protein